MGRNIRKSLADYAQEAATAHTDLNIFGGIVALLEGGTVSADVQPHDFQIIQICKIAQQQCLHRYDQAIAALNRSPTPHLNSAGASAFITSRK